MTTLQNSSTSPTSADRRPPATPERGWRPGALEVLTVALILVLIGQRWIVGQFDSARLQAGATIFVSIVVQALPFLVLGTVLSVPSRPSCRRRSGNACCPSGGPRRTRRGLRWRGAARLRVCVGTGGRQPDGAGCGAGGGADLPAGRPRDQPSRHRLDLRRLPGQPAMAAARFGASLVTAVVMGWLWLRLGKSEWIRMPRRDHLTGRTNWHTFRLTATHDFLHAGDSW